MNLGPFAIPGYYIGDCRDLLAQLPDESVQCCVTSPPYWGLRDYGIAPVVWGGDLGCKHEWGVALPATKSGHRNAGFSERAARDYRGGGHKATEQERHDPKHAGQFCQKCGAWLGALGLEPTPELYTQHMVEVFRHVWRVLRKDGTLWLNLGDSYATSKIRNPTSGDVKWGNTLNWSNDQCRPAPPGLKRKDMVGMPWRVAFALQSDGWWLRSDIIFSKPNPMPESVTDRPTKSHEYIFLLAKSARYFFDHEAVREPQTGNAHGRGNGITPKTVPDGQGIKANESFHAGTARWHEAPDGRRNIRTVWEIATQSYSEVHFATFPEDLPKRCILAGTSPRACEKCGAPFARIVEKERSFESGSGRSGNMPEGKNGPEMQGGGETKDIRRGPVVHTTTKGFQPTCDCQDIEGTGQCVVLDPFFGSGTVGQVAESLGRLWIGFDANPEYKKMQDKRTAQKGLRL